MKITEAINHYNENKVDLGQLDITFKVEKNTKVIATRVIQYRNLIHLEVDGLYVASNSESVENKDARALCVLSLAELLVASWSDYDFDQKAEPAYTEIGPEFLKATTGIFEPVQDGM